MKVKDLVGIIYYYVDIYSSHYVKELAHCVNLAELNDDFLLNLNVNSIDPVDDDGGSDVFNIETTFDFLVKEV